CVNTEGSYTCKCRYGYELDPITKQKCIDIDECKGIRGTHYHQDCHKCINTIGSYTCECDEYYELDPNEPKCIDINECEDNTHHEDCHSCVNTEGSYTCKCRYGYELDPITKQKCIDIDECKGIRGTHYHQDCHKCINTIGSYTCECDEYYELDPNEPKCIDINECEDNTHHKDCHSCVNTEGSYTCECRDGYDLDPITKQKCIVIDECLADNGVAIDKDCHTCNNTQGSYTCECNEGYERHPNEKRCIGQYKTFDINVISLNIIVFQTWMNAKETCMTSVATLASISSGATLVCATKHLSLTTIETMKHALVS
ncbi:hypothetical protein CAPTEDRAFT_131237, partial [Capitella teleta]